jgi:hypothetical protein
VAAATIVAAASSLVAATTVLAAEHAAPAASWSTEGPFFLLEAQTSRLFDLIYSNFFKVPHCLPEFEIAQCVPFKGQFQVSRFT